MRCLRFRAISSLGALVLVTLGLLTAPSSGSVGAAADTAGVPRIRHVFVINIENRSYAATWGATSAAPYLARTLRRKGVLLSSYYATAHYSQPNYVAQISGQGPDGQMQRDCGYYSRFVQHRTAWPGQAVGHGCVFPRSVRTLPDQLSSTGRTWRGYMEDMNTPCRHPALGSRDHTQLARVGDQYALKHNPFMYFRSITWSATCTRHVVGLRKSLPRDLARISRTPNLSYLTPNLCNDGHDQPCVNGGRGGLAAVNSWMRYWVPKILNSPAFKANGVLVITSDESDSRSTACCRERRGPNAARPGIYGPGGGRTGALVISRFTRPGTWSARPYNHYSLLASIEDIFGLPHLGYARTPGLNRFGSDVYNR